MSEAGHDLTRQDLEAVIRRAVELEAESGGSISELSEEDLLRIGGDVGLSEASIRRALAEHRASSVKGLLADRGLVSRLCGSGLVSASRTVPRPAEEVRKEIEAHFLANERLRLIRRTQAASLWEPDRSVVASILRAVDVVGRGYQLAKKGQALELRVVAVDDESSQVSLTADLGSQRAGWFWGMGVGSGGIASLLAAVFITGYPGVPDIAALGAPVLLAAGVALARTGYRRITDNMRRVLEGLLDRLEHEEPLESPRPSWRELLR